MRIAFPPTRHKLSQYASNREMWIRTRLQKNTDENDTKFSSVEKCWIKNHSSKTFIFYFKTPNFGTWMNIWRDNNASYKNWYMIISLIRVRNDLKSILEARTGLNSSRWLVQVPLLLILKNVFNNNFKEFNIK